MDSKITLICSTDRNYVPYCGIMLTSAFETNKADIGQVFILTTELDAKTRSAFEPLSERYGIPIHVYDVDRQMLSGIAIPETNYLTLACYFRILAPVLLPRDIGKVLYLDCDMIVNGSLKPLWETDIEDVAYAAVLDEDTEKPFIYELLNYPAEYGYINSGAMLMNLDYWREHDAVNRCLDYARKRDASQFHANDQDVISAVLCRERKTVDPSYNLLNGFILTELFKAYSEPMKQAILQAVKHPVIVHFEGPAKPWRSYCRNPFTPWFQYYKSISLWKDLPPISPPTLKSLLRRAGYSVLRALRLIEPTYIIPRVRMP